MATVFVTMTMTHRMTKTAEYGIWSSMKSRCLNANSKAYSYYGGRGIGVCSRWSRSFERFYSDMGPRPSELHTLDRFPDLNGDYEPGNVRWATMQEQSVNRRSTIFVDWNGETLPLADLCRDLGIDYERTRARIFDYGWTIARAVQTRGALTPRDTSSSMLTFQGRTMCLRDWSREVGASADQVSRRLAEGWTVERALTTPARRKAPNGKGPRRRAQ